VARTRTQITSALLIVLLGTAPAIAVVCESFCPAHASRAVEVASPSAAPAHSHHHHAVAAADDHASRMSRRVEASSPGCCASPPQTITAARVSSRESVAAAADRAPAVVGRSIRAFSAAGSALPTAPSNRAPAMVILRI
jgi:hypothetical protein